MNVVHQTTLIKDGEATDADAELQRSADSSLPPVYSVFTRNQKIFIVSMASIICFFSPFTSSIYFPAIKRIAVHYNTPVTRINISVTTFMIVQGVAPMFTGNFGDTAGRRPAIILCFVLYLAANIGLAVQDNYAALLGLRCLQAAGSSGSVALSRGVIADVSTPAERGSYMGFAMTSISLAPAIAPVIGGALADRLGWRAVFWFLAILTVAVLVPYILFTPESNRNVVGDGSIRLTKWYNMSLLDILHRRKDDSSSTPVRGPEKPQKRKRDRAVAYWKGPWRAVELFFEPDIALISIYVCLVYGALNCMLTSLPVLFGPTYGFSDLRLGLCYIPVGVGCCVAGIVNGKLLDWNWKRVAVKNQLPYDRKRDQDLREFPVERARLELVFPSLLPGILATIPFGWALQYKAPLAVPLILQFITGWSFTGASNMIQNLTIDLFPGEAATTSANNSLARRLFGAGAAAAIMPMLDGMGWGWCYTFIGLLCLATMPILCWEMKRGPRFRESRRLQMERLREEKGSNQSSR